MKNFALLTLLFAISLYSSNAQQSFQMEWPAGDTVSVFGDKINVRSQPSTDAGTVTQWVAGDLLRIVEASTQTATMNGITLPWYKVQSLDKRTSGFVWGGLLSVLPPSKLGDTRFVGGIVKMNPGKEPENLPDYTFEIRAVRNSAVVSKAMTNIKGQGYIYFHPVEAGARGLKGYTGLMTMTLSGEACGIPWYDWYVLWNGSQLSSLPVCESISDADVFSHLERYLFPQGGDEFTPGHFGAEDQVYFAISHEEKVEREDGTGWDENGWTRARLLRWDGKQWIRPKNMGEPRE
jgi:Bacterial SH3 domain